MLPSTTTLGLQSVWQNPLPVDQAQPLPHPTALHRGCNLGRDVHKVHPRWDVELQFFAIRFHDRILMPDAAHEAYNTADATKAIARGCRNRADALCIGRVGSTSHIAAGPESCASDQHEQPQFLCAFEQRWRGECVC